MFKWSDDKNKLLMQERNICFEDIVTSVDHGKLLDIVKNPNKDREDQYCSVVDIGNYAYVVPFVKSESSFFLKTILRGNQ